jgi:putative nucleotidyltransferase with HDIG domain
VDVQAARELAERELAAELPARWRHVRAVAAKGELVAEALGLDRELLISAAWLHDIGYSPNVARTGFHPLDGARFLRARSVDEGVVRLVAHHSCATIEAEERGLDDELRAEFPHGDNDLAEALWFCDMTTGPNGEDLTVSQRLAEIRSRYGEGHVVTRFVERAEADIRAAVERTERRLRAV